MLPCSKLGIRSVLLAVFLLVFAVFLSPATSLAQDQDVPKIDLFTGYQWLHPGGTVPTPFGDYNNPTPFKIPDMSKGFGLGLTYNLDRYWGLEGDFGHNWGDSNYESTVSFGPRLMLRT